MFALVFSIVPVASRGDDATGTYTAGVLAGRTDVDAISLSMAPLAGSAVPLPVAATTVFLGMASNTIIMKAKVATVLGPLAFRPSRGRAVRHFTAGGCRLCRHRWI